LPPSATLLPSLVLPSSGFSCSVYERSKCGAEKSPVR
jgi:hypothetical protein